MLMRGKFWIWMKESEREKWRYDDAHDFQYSDIAYGGDLMQEWMIIYDMPEDASSYENW